MIGWLRLPVLLVMTVASFLSRNRHERPTKKLTPSLVAEVD
jgi:hypothetical protein